MPKTFDYIYHIQYQLIWEVLENTDINVPGLIKMD